MKTAQRFLGLVVLAAAVAAEAHERRFTFTNESNVLPKGGREIEVWMTPRLGREEFYARFDQRLEFEVGVTDRLMAAMYLNAKAFSEPDATGAIQSGFEFEGMSGELKYKLMDPVADPVGLALYTEITGRTHEAEVEAKVIVDKKIGPVLLAANLVFEHEWIWEAVREDVATEMVFEADLAAAYFLTDHLSVGAEVRNKNVMEHGDFEYSAIYAGPVVAYAAETWWIAATLQAQLPAPKLHDTEAPDLRVLDAEEKFNGRVIFALMF